MRKEGILKLLSVYGKAMGQPPPWTWSEVRNWLSFSRRWGTPGELDAVFADAMAREYIVEKDGKYALTAPSPPIEAGYRPDFDGKPVKEAPPQRPTRTEASQAPSPAPEGVASQTTGKLLKKTSVSKPPTQLISDEEWEAVWNAAYRKGADRGERVVWPTSGGLRWKGGGVDWERMLSDLMTKAVRDRTYRISASQVMAAPGWTGAPWPVKAHKASTKAKMTTEQIEVEVDKFYDSKAAAQAAKANYLKWAESERGKKFKPIERHGALLTLLRRLEELRGLLSEYGVELEDASEFFACFAEHGASIESENLKACAEGTNNTLPTDFRTAFEQDAENRAANFFRSLEASDPAIYTLAFASKLNRTEEVDESGELMMEMPTIQEINAYIDMRAKRKYASYRNMDWDDVAVEFMLDAKPMVLYDFVRRKAQREPDEIEERDVRIFAEFRPLLKRVKDEKAYEGVLLKIDKLNREDADRIQAEEWNVANDEWEVAKREYDELKAKPMPQVGTMEGVTAMAEYYNALKSIRARLAKALERANVALPIVRNVKSVIDEAAPVGEGVLTGRIERTIPDMESLAAQATLELSTIEGVARGAGDARILAPEAVKAAVEARGDFERIVETLRRQVKEHEQKQDALSKQVSEQQKQIEKIGERAQARAVAPVAVTAMRMPTVVSGALVPIEIARTEPIVCGPCGTLFLPYAKSVANTFKRANGFPKDEDWWWVCESCKKAGRSPGTDSWAKIPNLMAATYNTVMSGGTSNQLITLGVPVEFMAEAMRGPPFQDPSSDVPTAEMVAEFYAKYGIPAPVEYPPDVRRHIVEKLKHEAIPPTYEDLRKVAGGKIPFEPFDDALTWLVKSGYVKNVQGRHFLVSEPTDEEYDSPLVETPQQRDDRRKRIFRYMVTEARWYLYEIELKRGRSDGM